MVSERLQEKNGIQNHRTPRLRGHGECLGVYWDLDLFVSWIMDVWVGRDSNITKLLYWRNRLLDQLESVRRNGSELFYLRRRPANQGFSRKTMNCTKCMIKCTAEDLGFNCTAEKYTEATRVGFSACKSAPAAVIDCRFTKNTTTAGR